MGRCVSQQRDIERHRFQFARARGSASLRANCPAKQGGGYGDRDRRLGFLADDVYSGKFIIQIAAAATVTPTTTATSRASVRRHAIDKPGMPRLVVMSATMRLIAANP